MSDDEPPVPELVGVREIAELLEVSRQRADRLTKRDDFPEPVARLAGGAVYTKRSVQEWAAGWERRRTGRPRKNT